MNKVDVVEQSRLRKDIPPFRPGDQVKVHVKVVEGQRHRIQVFEGVVLGRRGGGLRESFTVRKISFGVGVERTFPLHGPTIDKVEIVRHGKVRRAKLYYLRERVGRRAKIDERRTRIVQWSPELAAEPGDEAGAAEEPVEATAATDEGPAGEAAIQGAEGQAPAAGTAVADEAASEEASAPAADEPVAAETTEAQAPEQTGAPETAETPEDEGSKSQA